MVEWCAPPDRGGNGVCPRKPGAEATWGAIQYWWLARQMFALTKEHQREVEGGAVLGCLMYGCFSRRVFCVSAIGPLHAIDHENRALWI